MMKLHRPAPPDWLAAKYTEWGEEYERRKKVNSTYKFSWRTYQGKKVNVHLVPVLVKMTKDHCSFCDGYPMRAFGGNSIEHFKPKSNPRYYRLAYQWENLFLSCPVCQGVPPICRRLVYDQFIHFRHCGDLADFGGESE